MGPCSSKAELQTNNNKIYASDVKVGTDGKIQKTQQISDIFAFVDPNPIPEVPMKKKSKSFI